MPGYFDQTLSQLDGKSLALLYIDADLYQSYLTVLQTLYQKVAEGGVIVFDEYENERTLSKYPGPKLAIDEYFEERASDIQRDTDSDMYYLVKRT